MRTLPLPLLLLVLFSCSSVHAQLYINITQAPYSANSQCASDAGPAINQAITDSVNQGEHAYASGSQIYFPPGCYLINTQIQDTGIVNINAIGISYLGFGRAMLQAGSTLTGSIMKFGDDTHVPSRRHVAGILFQCSTTIPNLDGIDIDGLVNSEFEDIEIRDCTNYAIQTVGTNTHRDGISFEGGTIVGNTAHANGVFAGTGSNFWTFKGTRISSNVSTTGVGLELEGAGDVCAACDVEGWYIGLAAGQIGAVDGLQISGGYFENYNTPNAQSIIRIGNGSASGLIGRGVAIHGAYINGGKITSRCIDLEQADGFSITGNRINECNSPSLIINAQQDAGSQQGADNGVIGPNNIAFSTGAYSLLGKNITFIAPACLSSVSPASCGFTAAGFVALPSGGNNLTVNDTFVAATSRIIVTEDMTLGAQLGVTCNTVGGRTYSVTSKTVGTSFTITSSTAPSGNPACLTFHMEN